MIDNVDDNEGTITVGFGINKGIFKYNNHKICFAS